MSFRYSAHINIEYPTSFDARIVNLMSGIFPRNLTVGSAYRFVYSK